MQLLGGQEWEAPGQVKSHLAAKDAQGAGAGAIAALDAIRQDIGEQVEVLPLGVIGRVKAQAGRDDGRVH
jgi:hypothetical protein